MNNLLITDLIVAGIGCGAYLQYKSFKAIGELPSRSQLPGQKLSRANMLRAAEGLAYAALGIVFETLSLSKAFFG